MCNGCSDGASKTDNFLDVPSVFHFWLDNYLKDIDEEIKQGNNSLSVEWGSESAESFAYNGDDDDNYDTSIRVYIILIEKVFVCLECLSLLFNAFFLSYPRLQLMYLCSIVIIRDDNKTHSP